MALELLSLTHFNESVQTDNIIWIVHHKKKKKCSWKCQNGILWAKKCFSKNIWKVNIAVYYHVQYVFVKLMYDWYKWLNIIQCSLMQI